MAEAVHVPTVGWDTFLSDHFRWAQGEHVTLIGPTGSGKTTLVLAILHLRRYVVFYGTKPRDKTLDKLAARDGWKIIRSMVKWPRTTPASGSRVIFWPKYATPKDQPAQTAEITAHVESAFTTGGWTLVVDETWWWTNVLGLKRWLEALWSQGRSIGITLVAGTQRPAFIPLMAYDQATHVFFWRDNDETNLRRISGMNGLHSHTIRATVSALPHHHVLYVNTRTGQMVVTQAPPP